MRRKLYLTLAALLAFAATAAAQPKYVNPTGNEFPILAWYSILGDGYITPERYAELREAGFNISFSHFTGEEEIAAALKACRGSGVKLMLTCRELESSTAECVARFKDDPSVAGWFLRDEPITADFDSLRQFRDRVYSADSSHLVYLNLFPSIVPAEALQADSYEDYVHRFVSEVALPQISYDFYPIVEDDGKIYARPQFYENLEVARKVSLERGMPFWAFCLATAHKPYPVPTEAHLRFEAYSALAYGAQCIQHFTYATPGREVWNFHNAPIDSIGQRTDVYYKVQSLNRDIQSLAKVFLGATAVDVGHTGKVIPQGTRRPESLPEKFGSLESDGEGLLVSRLCNGSRSYVMLVNRSIDYAQNVEFTLEKPLKRIVPCGKAQRLRAGAHKITLKPGDFALFRVK